MIYQELPQLVGTVPTTWAPEKFSGQTRGFNLGN